MALPAILRRLAGPSQAVLVVTESDSAERVIVMRDDQQAALDLGSTTTAEVVVYMGEPGSFQVVETGTATITAPGDTGEVTISFTSDQTADMGNAITWPPLVCVDENTLRWRLTLIDGTSTVTTHRGPVRVYRREA